MTPEPNPQRRADVRREPDAALPARVLFVDDEPELTDGLVRSLRKQPWSTLTANSAGEALELLAHTEVDVVVSDQCMPGMKGASFLSLVRERYPDTVRMMLSGESDLNAAIEAVNRAEVFRYIRKPCDTDALVASLQEALVVARARRRSPGSSSAAVHHEQDNATFEQAMSKAWMAFQAVVDPRSGKAVAFESLLRIDHPEITNPGLLLALAERLGRIAEVEHFVRRAVATQIPLAPPEASVLVNVHPRTLERDDLADLFDPLEPFSHRVVLEVTERDAIEDTVELQARLNELRERGFRVAVDDLGAGYSGLTSFVLLKPDIVKFDMQLVRGIDQDPTRSMLVAALAHLCEDLDIVTIAEGIETRAELEKVVELGCDWVQGFYYAKPGRGFEFARAEPIEAAAEPI